MGTAAAEYRDNLKIRPSSSMPRVSRAVMIPGHYCGGPGRAGLGGVALSFCDAEEKPLLKDIEKLIGKKIPVVEDHPYPLILTEAVIVEPPKKISNRRPNYYKRSRQ